MYISTLYYMYIRIMYINDHFSLEKEICLFFVGEYCPRLVYFGVADMILVVTLTCIVHPIFAKCLK